MAEAKVEVKCEMKEEVPETLAASTQQQKSNGVKVEQVQGAEVKVKSEPGNHEVPTQAIETNGVTQVQSAAVKGEMKVEEVKEEVPEAQEAVAQQLESNELSPADIQSILADETLEKIHNGFEVVFCHNGQLPNPERSGGFFKVDVSDRDRRCAFDLVKDHTKLGKLGTLSSLPTEKRNFEYAQSVGKSPNDYAIFLHTLNAEDHEDRQRIVDNWKVVREQLRQMNILMDPIEPGDYKTALQVDMSREFKGWI